MCYTGDILDPSKDKYTLKYYVDLAKELEQRGAHMLAIKDMSGLLKPYAAKKLVSTLKQEVGLPIHLHTHDTTGNQVAALLMAAEAGVDVVDCRHAPRWPALPASPPWTRVVAALQGNGAGHRAGPAAGAGAVQLLGGCAPALRELRPRPEEPLPPTSTATRSPAVSTPTCGPRWSRWVWATALRRSRRCIRPSTICWATR